METRAQMERLTSVSNGLAPRCARNHGNRIVVESLFRTIFGGEPPEAIRDLNSPAFSQAGCRRFEPGRPLNIIEIFDGQVHVVRASQRFLTKRGRLRTSIWISSNVMASSFFASLIASLR
jgi:hypothetical protein